MKKLISTFVLIFCISSGIFAQITYETTYYPDASNAMIGLVKLNQTTSKYLTVNYINLTGISYNVTYRLYNLDHSLYKTLSLIPDSFLLDELVPLSLQENLFNTDSKIEIAFLRYKGPNYKPSFKVVDEYGNVIFERDSVSGYHGDYFTNIVFDGFVNTESGTKLILKIVGAKDGNGKFDKKEIYSLGGTLISGIKEPDGNGEEMIELSPNPSREFTRISYKLPENVNTAEIIVYNLNGSELKRFTVDRTFSDLIVSTDNLPSGSYFYNLVADNQIIGTKKSFVIK